MDKYYINKTGKCLEIINKETNEKVHECCHIDNDINNEIYKDNDGCFKKAIFFKNGEDTCVIYHFVDDGDYQFPDIEIFNLETKEKIIFNPNLKMGYIDLQICEEEKIIILYGYIGGMMCSYDFYDFQGNYIDYDYDVRNLYNNRTYFYQYKIHGGKIFFELIIPTQYLDNSNYKYSIKNILDNLIVKEETNNLIIINNNYEIINKEEKYYRIGNRNKIPNENCIFKNHDCIIVSCINCTDKITMINLEIGNKIIEFNKRCENYDEIKLFKFKSNNIFKILLTNNNINNVEVIKENDFEDFKEFDIKNIEFYGLYTKINYFYYLPNFLDINFTDTFNFREWLSNFMLGYEYKKNGYILKSIFPDGICIVFKFYFSSSSFNKEKEEEEIIEFIIKMNLVELEDDITKVRYDNEKSKMVVNIKSY